MNRAVDGPGAAMGKTCRVYVIGLKGRTIDIVESEEDFKRMTVLSLKKKVLEISQIEVRGTSDLRLFFVNEQLEEKKKLADYGIQDRSQILAVLSLIGGGDVQRVRFSPVKHSCGNEDSGQ